VTAAHARALAVQACTYPTADRPENVMPKFKPTLFALAVTIATLAPAAAANAGLTFSNHNETLLLDD